ncbi:DUF2088 domain-containing protein [Nocardioides panaciterrulae]|uniref:DUF2088 domain-containing protein n=1 Tax=Nocardioides panaciterrulae TaxID=661492 RepID=A0A7Y9J9M0_9ACTN|nr:DUF2088 domain-containing protein [Nocardioides panaciterrulae]NYD40251.1 hypothetical protein [Nocardioides panaciterrulae]
MSDFSAPRLDAPRLSDLLGRRAPNLTLHRLRRRSPRTAPAGDPAERAYAALRPHLGAVRPGDSVAIGVGSRGINDIGGVVTGMVRALREIGAEPFVVPAMGSHGGADADGQRQTLASLGVTEEAVGAPVRATMETVSLGRVEDIDVAIDAYAAVADHIVLTNRLKSHTSFSGQVESGLAKMLAIGFGKQHGAEELHRLGPTQIERRIRAAARHICAVRPVLGGVALVETETKELAVVEFVDADGIGGAREAELLVQAKQHEPRLPFDQLDVLIVDAMGKNFSGTGMDTNVIGRRMVRGMPEIPTPRVTNIVCLEVTAQSHGNAVGLGLADFIPARALAGVDPVATYANTLTAGSQGVQRAQIPITLADDADAVAAAILTCDVADPSRLRVARIRNTLHLDDLLVTEPLLEEARQAYDDRAERTALFGAEGELGAW